MPETLRPLFIKYTINDGEWFNFIREAKEYAWVVFQNNILEQTHNDKNDIFNYYKQSNQRTDNKRRQNNSNTYGQKYCTLHGRCKHETKECKLMHECNKRGVKITRNDSIRAIEKVNDDSDTEDLNKDDLNYMILTYSLEDPDFNIDVYIYNNLKASALLDTGADVTIIPEYLAKKCNRYNPAKTKASFKAANGGNIRVLGKINITFTYNDRKYETAAYVVENKINKIILGKNFISKHPHTLSEILQNSKKILSVSENTDENSTEKIIIHLQNAFADVFCETIDKNTVCNIKRHSIETLQTQPIRQYNNAIPYKWEAQIDEEVTNLLSRGVIREINSEWNSRIVPIKKKDGKLRMCIDFRSLNAVTIKTAFKIPLIDEIIDKLAGYNWFSTLDATTGYYQVAINEKDTSKTAFSWKRRQYEFIKMPFGLCNAPQTFQSIMDYIFKDEENIVCYLDDIILKTATKEEHTKLLTKALLKLRSAGIKLKPSKCNFYKQKINILGFVVHDGFVYPDTAKIECIKNAKKPKTYKELKSFLGLCDYNRSFVPKYAHITASLYQLFKKEDEKST